MLHLHIYLDFGGTVSLAAISLGGVSWMQQRWSSFPLRSWYSAVPGIQNGKTFELSSTHRNSKSGQMILQDQLPWNKIWSSNSTGTCLIKNADI